MTRNLGLICACAAGILVPLELWTNPAQADEVFAPSAAMALPAGNGCHYPPPYPSPAPCKPLQSRDIAYVDEATHTYLLADRSNAAIDVFDTLTNSFVKFLQPTDPFAGAQPASVVTGSGPNGVIMLTGKLLPPGPGCSVACNPVFHNGQPVSMVWAGDAPTSGSTGTSHIKVMDLVSGATLGSLNTGGVRRADELCFVTLPSGAPDPKHPYVMIANDNVLDNYLTIWRWDNFAFVQRISLAGSDPYAAPFNTADGAQQNAANGIEQCKFNPRNGHFYLAVPATQTGSPTHADGFVLKISLPVQSTPTTPPSTSAQHAKVVAAYEIFPATTGCGVTDVGGGPAGLSIGPSFNGTNTNGLIALGCGAGGGSSLVIDDSGNTMLPVPLPAGTDETWYDPVSNHFFFPQSGTGPASGWLGVVDANQYPPRSFIQEDGDNTGGSPVQDTTVPHATGNGSVAVFPGTCGSSSTPTRLSRVYLATRSTLTTPNNGSKICSGFLGAFPATGAAPQWPGGTTQAPTAIDYDQWGCIAVYTASAATCTSTGHANPSP
jgi:hypothetical protein